MKKMKTSSKQLVALTCGALLVAGGTARAGLSIVNGDFENNAPASNVMDVDSWFDDNGEGQSATQWWLSSWYGPTVSPNGSSVMGLSWSGDHGSWAYQDIGVNDSGLTDLQLQLDLGSFTDAGGDRDIGIELGVYQSDGTFSPADDLDIDGASGITFIGNTTTHALLPAGGESTMNVSVDISSANTTDNLFLRLINYSGGTGQPWAAVDNISVVPEPATYALGGLGLAALLIMRRKRQS